VVECLVIVVFCVVFFGPLKTCQLLKFILGFSRFGNRRPGGGAKTHYWQIQFETQGNQLGLPALG
jgi:hypothetical protein